ncbi:MAG: NAD(P)-dependent alcohol dehydrogenase [Oscillospiraceae bacterium]|nr:NAD(P)-dependent alcohol dehydrogenase [Oscillospiraceae bacterium]
MAHGKMKTAVMTGLKKIEIAEAPIPDPKAGQALVRIECVGICGSDLHYFEAGRLGYRIVKPPFILGHEACGVVEAVGEGVSNVKPGDRVALEPGRPCGVCDFCRKGLYNLCGQVAFFGSPPTDGVFREYVAYDARLCFPLPDNMTAIEGAMVEPLAIGLYAALRSGAGIGKTAVVTGAGCIGLMSMLALKTTGVSRVYITDIEQKRLNKAASLGASAVINAKEHDTVEEVIRLTGGAGCDLVIEAAGTEITTVQAIRMTKKGAVIMLIGQTADGEIKLPITDAIAKELTFMTIFRYRHAFPLTIEVISSGVVNVREVVTHVYSFGDIQEAFEQSLSDKANIVKSVIKIS